MRVLVDAVQYGPATTGTDRHAAETLAALTSTERGLDLVVCVSTEHPYVAGRLPTSVETVGLNGRRQARWSVYGFARTARNARCDAMLSFHNLVGPVAGGPPSVVTLLDVIPFEDPSLYFSSPARAQVSKALARATLRRAGALVAISEHTAAAAASHFPVSASKLFIGAPGVSSGFSPEADATEARLALHLPDQFLLALGGDETRKNNHAVLSAYQALPSDIRERFPLVIAGPRGEHSPVGARWLGWVPEELLPGLYAAASALVFASVAEGFGLPALEAMACGTPVVLSRKTSLPEVGGEAVSYIDPHDVRDMTRVLIDVLRHDQQRETMRGLGLTRAREFTWERTADVYAEAIAFAVKSEGGSR